MTEKRLSRVGLFAPFVIVLVVLAGWTVWWFHLAGQVRDRIGGQVAALNDAGWAVSHSKTEIGGWPFRVRVSLGQTRVAAPSGQALSSSDLVAQANAWNPTTWVMASSGELVLTRGEKGDVAIGGEARMSLHGLSQRWPNVAVELIRPTFTPMPAAGAVAEPFPLSRAGQIQFYLRPHLAPAGTPGADTSVDILLRLLDAEGRTGGPVEAFAQSGKLTAQIEAVIERADRISGVNPSGVFSAWSLAGGRFSRIRGEITAGESRALVSSDSLMAGPDGRLQGNVTLDATRPLPALVGLLRSGGATGPLLNSPMGQAAIDGLSGSGPTPAGAPAPTEDVKLSVAFREGRTWLGPFPLAPAPKLF